jgi:hypothetical protein
VADKRNVASALECAARGWLVFPAALDCKKSHKSKKYSGREWGLTADPDEIRADFARWSDARIGLATGPENRIVIIDVDTVEGHGVDGNIGFKELQSKHGPLPATLQAVSPSGSIHYYLQHPGKRIKIVTRPGVAHGVDCKGDGGMVIAPGSVNSDGRSYRWLNSLPIAPLPERWVELLKFKKPTIRERATAAVNARRVERMIQRGGISAYVAAALKDEIDRLARAPATTRNSALNKAAFSLFQFVHGGLLQRAEVERRLIDACTANGLIADDGLSSVIATISSALNGAAAKPRRGLG